MIEQKIMKILIFLNLIMFTASSKKVNRYSGFLSNKQVQSICYIKEVLVNMSHNPNQLAIDKENNIVYFSSENDQGMFSPMILDLDSKPRQLRMLKGVKDSFAMSHEDKTGVTYFGGSQGIYKYVYKEKKLFRLGVSNVDVWWLMCAKKHIYFIQFPGLNAYVYIDRTIKSVPHLKRTVVYQFVFDFHDNMYFVNGSGLFGIRSGSSEHVLLRDRPAFFGMTVDNTGQVFVCSEDGIYVVSKMVQKVKHIISVPNVQAIGFDRDNNLIYSDSTELVRLLRVTADEYYKNAHKSGLLSSISFCN